MPNIKIYHIILKACIVVVALGFFLYGNQPLFGLAYVFSYIFVVLRAFSIPSKKRLKLLMVVSYTLLLVLLMTFIKIIDFSAINGFKSVFGRLFSVAGVLMPFVLERFFVVNKYITFYMPSLQEVSTFSLNEMKNNKDAIIQGVLGLKKVGKSVSLNHAETIVTDLPRHNSFRYINKGSLTEDYFNVAYDTLDDFGVYIVISNTGSAASELISVFTKKQYNHASLAFDADLKTIVSYNGGERVYPPGLNREMIEFFNKKEEASIIVYRLEVTANQKKKMIDQIRIINEEGSAYNILGLIFKYSHKSNIMFCSQFVYKMLKSVGLAYFEKPENTITPTDLVELDYYRKLTYVCEIEFKETPKKSSAFK